VKISLRDLAVRHAGGPRTAIGALRSISLEVDAGEAVAVIGPSGAGKTTLLEAIACAHRPAAGRIALDGCDPWRLAARELRRLRARLFLAPQAPPLPPRQRVVTSVLAGRLPAMGLARSLRSLLAPDDVPAAFAALERFGLGDKLFERVDRLSSGERQRVGLARALVSPATLWLVDEPLSALDPTRARDAAAVLLERAGERRITLIVSLHQVDMALDRFPRIVGLRAGRVAFDLPVAEVTKALLDALYAPLDLELPGAPADASGGEAPSGRVAIGFR